MEAARRERDVAARELDEVVRQAHRYLTSTNPKPRLINQRITKINEREERLRHCHYTYLGKASISIDDEDSISYLTEKTDAAIDCMDRCTIFIDDLENEEKSSIDVDTQKNKIYKRKYFVDSYDQKPTSRKNLLRN